MPLILYNIFLFFFRIGVRLFSLFNGKARKWVVGRRNIFDKLSGAIPADTPVIWMHCASLGEFEQGRPVIEKIKTRFPRYKVLLTFFSPSGYESQKNYKGADWIFYLPMDGPKSAKRFLEIVHPELVIFVKYEFWYYYLKKIKYRNIPLILISAFFRNDMSFFKWYGGLQRKMLSRFDHLFVQDKNSFELVKQIGLEKISSISGDTRFDRVIEIAGNNSQLPIIEKFINNRKAIVAGSTWPEDEEVIQKIASRFENLTWIIAPHDTSAKHLEFIQRLFPNALIYSKLEANNGSPGKNIYTNSKVLIIDSIGLLSQLYRFGHINYVGGGLRPMGVHNVIEAAVYYKPVLFGGEYQKYREATGLVAVGGGLPFTNPKKNGQMLGELINGLLVNEKEYNYCSKSAGEYVKTNRGATSIITDFIQENRLLTS